jgi:hypothetical protein
VSADAQAAPAFGAWAADEERPESPAAGPGTLSASPAFETVPLASPFPDVVPTQRFPGPDTVAAFEAAAELDPGEAAAAEEMLVDRILDRLDDRMRDESIRRFGLSGGVT